VELDEYFPEGLNIPEQPYVLNALDVSQEVPNVMQDHKLQSGAIFRGPRGDIITKREHDALYGLSWEERNPGYLEHAPTAKIEPAKEALEQEAEPLDPIRSLLGNSMIDLMAEKANGGVCAISVNSILADLGEMKSAPLVKEVYDKDADDFRMTTTRKLVGRSLLGAYKYAEVTAPEDFSQLGNPAKLRNGLDVRLGFHQQKLGVLTTEGSFVPVVQFIDKRDADSNQYEDGDCSAGIFVESGLPLGENMVVTNADQEKVIVGVQEMRGLVLAKTVLDEINRLQQAMLSSKDNRDMDASTQRLTYLDRDNPGVDTSTLLAYLDIETVMNRSLLLDSKVSYASEQQLRLSLRALYRNNKYPESNGVFAHPDVSLGITKHEGDNGTATDFVAKTVVKSNAAPETATMSKKQIKRAGGPKLLEDVIEETVMFPDGQYRAEQLSWRLRMGKRIGQAALVECVSAVPKTTDDIIKHALTRPGLAALPESVVLNKTEMGQENLAVAELIERAVVDAKILATSLLHWPNLEFEEAAFQRLTGVVGDLFRRTMMARPGAELEVVLAPNLELEWWKHCADQDVWGNRLPALKVTNDEALRRFDQYAAEKDYVIRAENTNKDWTMYVVDPVLACDYNTGSEISCTPAVYLAMQYGRVLNGKHPLEGEKILRLPVGRKTLSLEGQYTGHTASQPKATFVIR
jgi:hypothetical protein